MAALLNLRKGRGSEHSAGSVTADRILKAWDEEDLTSNEFSGNGGVVEPESPPSERTTMAGLLRKCFLSARFEVLMSCLVLTNTVWMAAQLQVEGGIYGAAWRGETDLSSLSTWRSIFMTGEQCFAAIFVLEVWLRVLVLRRAFFMVWLNYIDFFVGIACMAELIVVMRDGGTSSLDTLFLLRLLRVGKLARGLKLVGLTSNLSSLQLLVKCLVSSRAMLFWTFCLLALLQAVAGIILNMFAHQYFQEAMHDLSKREAVYLYFGTFTRSFLSMFEIMFANWGPPCRVLVEHISEWFAVFFLLYRCVFGFALLNVVNSVFVQQTMKTASSDEELAFKQKEKDTGPMLCHFCYPLCFPA
ncbi:unnamed protein product [Symbiodinium pilosum]|uniref:Ion transport domain-containing protein n=1 Tax=Symbiodinium pilosum TaxID=2952 RepID=A0A812JXN2_SYMPI|nr:unnamed protein product [Symbiodinium pilosum]